MVFDGFGTNFNDFWWLGGRLETSFSIGFWGVPELSNHGRLVVSVLLSGPHSIRQTVSSSNSACKIHPETCRIEGYEKAGCKIRKYEKSKLYYALITTEESGERSSKSFAAWWPLFEGPADLEMVIYIIFG